MILISIKKRADFLNLSKSNINFHSKSCLILANKTPEKYLINPHSKKIDEFCRFGLTVTKKIGNAVIRNKIKRRLREIFRKLHQEQMTKPFFDYVIIAKPKITFYNFQEIVGDVKFCLKHINRLIAEDESKNKE